jgi:hypothetical protein
MTTFLNFHAFAAARGEGLHPELRLLFERAATSPVSETVPERVNVSLFPQTLSPADGRVEPESRNTGPTSCCLGETKL